MHLVTSTLMFTVLLQVCPLGHPADPGESKHTRTHTHTHTHMVNNMVAEVRGHLQRLNCVASSQASVSFFSSTRHHPSFVALVQASVGSSLQKIQEMFPSSIQQILTRKVKSRVLPAHSPLQHQGAHRQPSLLQIKQLTRFLIPHLCFLKCFS